MRWRYAYEVRSLLAMAALVLAVATPAFTQQCSDSVCEFSNDRVWCVNEGGSEMNCDSDGAEWCDEVPCPLSSAVATCAAEVSRASLRSGALRRPGRGTQVAFLLQRGTPATIVAARFTTRRALAAGRIARLSKSPIRKYRLGWVAVDRSSGSATLEVGPITIADDSNGSATATFAMQPLNHTMRTISRSGSAAQVRFFIHSLVHADGTIWTADASSLLGELGIDKGLSKRSVSQ